MLKWRDYVMQASLILFAILLLLVWNDIRNDAVKYLFYVPIGGALTYSTQVVFEEKSFIGKLSGNLVGFVVTIASLLITIKFFH